MAGRRAGDDAANGGAPDGAGPATSDVALLRLHDTPDIGGRRRQRGARRRRGDAGLGGLVVRRVAGALITAALASLLVFLALDSTPGNAAVLGSGGEGNVLDPAAVAEREAEFGLGLPWPIRYLRWLSGVFRGDLGVSIQYRMPVFDLLAQRAGVTLALAGMALVVSFGLGLTLGWLASRYRRTTGAMIGSTALLSAIPSYALGTLFIAVLAVRLGWFPSFGAGAGGLDRLHHLLLPALVLGLGGLPLVSRVTRATLVDQLGRPHARVADARGIGPSRVLLRHALPGAWPAIATIGGLEVAGLLGGAAVTETVFALPGWGQLMVASVGTKDFAVVQALLLLSLAAYLTVSLTLDLVRLVRERRFAGGGSLREERR